MSLDLTPYINMLIVASTAGVAFFTVKATKRKTVAEAALGELSAAEAVTDAALKLISPLTERIEALELEIARLTEKIGQMQKLEEYLQAEIYSRDKKIRSLENKRAALVKRVTHLEEVCKRAGINGQDDEDEHPGE